MALAASWERTENERKICKALEEVAKQVGAKNIQSGACTSAVGAVCSSADRGPRVQWRSRT